MSELVVIYIVLITKHNYKLSTRFIKDNERYNRMNRAKYNETTSLRYKETKLYISMVDDDYL